MGIVDKEVANKWKEWLSERPDVIRNLAERLPPWHLYKLKTTGSLCTLHSYDEGNDGEGPATVKINITPDTDPTCLFPRRVFNINPDDLEIQESDWLIQWGSE